MPKPKCIVEGCDKEAYRTNKCGKHYGEARSNDPNRARCIQCENAATVRGLCQSCYGAINYRGGVFSKESMRDKCIVFLENIQETNECVLWPYRCDRLGYGVIRFGARSRGAHSVSLELRVPKPHPNAHALHGPKDICGNRNCVNPNHLRWGSPKENGKDMMQDGTVFSKLNPDKVLAIRALHMDGMMGKDIADKFGVSRAAISGIINGKKWVYVT